MQLKNVAKAIAAGALAAVMAGATIGFAATLADFPAPFISDSSVDTLIVVGTKPTTDVPGRVKDIEGAINIAARLGSVPGEEKTVTASATTTTTVSGGVLIETTSSKLNYGEQLYDIKTTIKGEDLPTLLGEKTLKDTKGTNKDTYTYTQKIIFNANSPTLYFAQPTEKTAGDYLYFDTNNAAYTYQIKFSPKMKVDASTSTNAENDLKNLKLTILGKEYTITDVTADGNGITSITLMGGAVEQTIPEGSSVDVTLDGKTYSIKAIYIGNSGAKFEVTYDGSSETTDLLTTDETYELEDGTEIGVKELLVQNLQGETDQVTISIGVDKLKLVDGNEVEKNGEDVDGTTVTIQDDDGGASDKLSSISISYTPTDEIYVGENGEFVDPVFGAFKIVFKGVERENPDTIKLLADGKEYIKLEATNSEGQDIASGKGNVIFYKGSGNKIYLGSGNEAGSRTYNKLVVLEGTELTGSDITDLEGVKFVYDFDGEAHVIQIYDIDKSNNQVTLKDLTTGTTYDDEDYNDGSATSFDILDHTFQLTFDESAKKITFTDITDNVDGVSKIETEHGATVAIGYKVTETIAAGDCSSYTLIDVNNDGSVDCDDATVSGSGTCAAGTGGNAGKICETGGTNTLSVVYYTADETAADDDNAAVIVHEESGTGYTPQTIVTTVSYDTQNEELDIGQPSAGTWKTDTGSLVSHSEDDTDIKEGVTEFGTYVYYDGSTDQHSLEITYPDEQAVGKAYIGGSDMTFSETGGEGGTVTYKEVVPITTPIAKLDSEVTDSDKNTKNLILVGGPCANSLVQELVDSGKLGDEYTCAGGTPGSAWEPDTGYIMLINDAFATGKAALIVAGSTAEETYQACNILQDYTAHASELTGTAVKIVNGAIQGPVTV